MTKNGTKKRAWAVGAAFFVFSGAVALGWPYEADLWALRMLQDHRSGFLDAVLSLFPLLGGLEVSGVILLVLLIGLFLRDRQALAGRILAVFVATGLLELAMKLFLPQVPVQKETTRAGDYAPLVALELPYPYPSGHVLRSVIIFGALCLLSGNWFSRAGFLLVMTSIGASRVYFGVHWASDVVGGVLLGAAGLLWAFERKAGQHLSSSAFQQEDERKTSA
jgi:undecaprenyl-diphosphatase